MAIIKGLEGTFDTVAYTYEKLRPGYVDELYKRFTTRKETIDFGLLFT